MQLINDQIMVDKKAVVELPDGSTEVLEKEVAEKIDCIIIKEV